ncbi:Hypothetical predicted protein, partial [Paramuricea clavata]
MMMKLQQYDSTIVYKKGSEMLLADTLSRHHLDNSTDEARSVDSDLDQVDSLDEINEILNCETATIFQDHTTKDQDLQQVKSFIQPARMARKLQRSISNNYPVHPSTRRINHTRRPR